MSKTFKGLQKTELNSTNTPYIMPLSEKCKVNAEGRFFQEKWTHEYSCVSMKEKLLSKCCWYERM
jgi:hypothetical protein